MKQFIYLLSSLAMLLCVSCCKGHPSHMPDIPVTDIYGNNVSADELTSGNHPVLMTFYATWCDPCTRELNELKSIYDTLQEKYGLEVVVVSVDKYPAQTSIVSETMAANGWNKFRLFFDVDGKLAAKLNLETIPTSYLIAPQGKIINETIGYEEDSVVDIEKLLSQLNNKKS